MARIRSAYSYSTTRLFHDGQLHETVKEVTFLFHLRLRRAYGPLFTHYGYVSALDSLKGDDSVSHKHPSLLGSTILYIEIRISN